MTKITDNIWLGDSKDAEEADLIANGISAILNFSADMDVKRAGDVLYAKVGLVDGPGNHMAIYTSAVLLLLSFLEKKKTVLVVDHTGKSRAAFVVICVLHMWHGRQWSRDYWHQFVASKRHGIEVHGNHKHAFNQMNWRLIATVMES